MSSPISSRLSALAHLGYGEGLHARVAGDEDRLQGLARGVLEHLVVEEGRSPASTGVGLGRPRTHRQRARVGPVREARRVGSKGWPLARPPACDAAHARSPPPRRGGRAGFGAESSSDPLAFARESRVTSPRQRAVLGRAAVDEVPDERHVEEPLGVLPEGVARVLAGRPVVLSMRQDDELEDVRLVADVREGVVVEGLGEVDGVEGEHPVARRVEHVAQAGHMRLALGVGDEVVRRSAA